MFNARESLNQWNSHPVQVKTNQSGATSKHCCVMSLQPWLREMFQGLWTQAEGGLSGSYGFSDPGQATVLDVCVNLWTGSRSSAPPCKNTNSTVMHTALTVMLRVWLPDEKGFLDDQSQRVPLHYKVERWRFAYKNTSDLFVSVRWQG